jgi:protein-L-isoaspartate(D-aspartate) O-methyltransferase
MNFEQARFNMIEQQIRTWEVLDQNVLDLLSAVPRENFVPAAYRNLAFADISIPLGHGEVMMQPKVEARMVQTLAIHPTDKILEVGTGSGYVTALLAKMGGQVTTVDIHADFAQTAQRQLGGHNITNVTFEVGDGVAGWKAGAPYDVIAVTGSVPLLTEDFQRQLANGGRLFVIVGEFPVMEALLITRAGEKEWIRESLFETDLPALTGAPTRPKFVF